MQEIFFPVINEKIRQLPIYLYSAGINFNQDEVERVEGYPAYQWIQCMEGRGIVTLGDKKFDLEKGMGMLIYKNEPHTYRALTKGWTTNWITFDGFVVKQLLHSFACYQSNYYYITNLQDITKIIEACVESGNRLNNIYELSALCYTLLMTVQYCMEPEVEGYTMKIDKVITFINKNYYKPITIAELANLINITPQYLCKLFAGNMNKRPMEYINELKIRKSKELMINSNKTIDRISKEVGFETSSYYGKCFKKIEKVTPSQFRRLFKG